MPYAHLLASLVFGIAIVLPLDQAGYGGLGFTIQAAWMLFAGAFVAAQIPQLRWPAFLIALAGLGSEAFAVLQGGFAAMVVARGFYVAFSGLLVVFLVWHLVRAREVDTNLIIGGICVYLLIGLLFYTLYTLVEMVSPGSFAVAGQPLAGADDIRRGRYPRLIYFSFVTLTTLGYGDIAPIASGSRSLAALEATIGQLYVAILISRLVGLHLAGTRAESE